MPAKIPTIWMLLSLVLAGCATFEGAPKVGTVQQGGCEAMRPVFPIKYHGNTDTASTINAVREANARFAAACP